MVAQDNLGDVELLAQRPDAARRILLEAQAFAQSHGLVHDLQSCNLARADLMLGDVASAMARIQPQLDRVAEGRELDSTQNPVCIALVCHRVLAHAGDARAGAAGLSSRSLPCTPSGDLPMMRSLRRAAGTLALLAAFVAHAQQPAAPQGEVQGTAWVHSADSLRASTLQGDLVLPATATGGAVWAGKFKDAPATAAGRKVPVVLFLHGSSGLGLKAIGEWQQWLATLGFASLAPDSFALAGHVTYKSPIDKASYERIHALRASEIAPALEALKAAPWADATRLVLAGTSEGAVPVARHAGTEFAARMLFAWSCEANYFVTEPRNAFEPAKPVLNVISASDPFFSKSNTWLGNADAQGHCAAALKDNPKAAVLLVPNAPHTLLNLPGPRHAVAGFLAPLLRP